MNCTMQVADVTKPLVATNDLTEAGNLVVMSNSGGVAKKLSDEDVQKIMKIIRDAPGNGIPMQKKGRKHIIEITVPKGGSRGQEKRSPMQVEAGKKKKVSCNDDDMDVGELFPRPAWKI